MRDLLIRLGLVDPSAPVATEKDGRVSLYTFRKTFAKRAAEGGMDVAELAAIMGHSPNSIDMLVRVYYELERRTEAGRPCERTSGGQLSCVA